MNRETSEEYLETIYKLSNGSTEESVRTGEIAKEMGFAPATVTEVLPKLEEEGYLVYRPYYGVTLTKKGLDLGMNVVRIHRVLEVFLERYFSLDSEQLHEKACLMEHIFDKDMIDEMCKRLGGPTECPHGNEIPSCRKKNCPLEGD
ncbi:MAG: metal-dependent transcriptional regulator [Candidatus Saliniplasma sp.]